MRKVRLAALVIASCGPMPNAATPANVVAKNVSASEGVIVTTACTPSGVETCFNANDDNCNGVIDEGCGVGTGVLQFIISWGDSVADVDLIVVDPGGVKVSKTNRPSTGLKYERDCPTDNCHQQNIENVYFEGSEPMRGKYIVEVALADAGAAELPVKVHLSARIGSRNWAMDLQLAPEKGQERKGFAFEL